MMRSYPRQLEALSSEVFLHRFSQIGTVDGIYLAMRRSREVRSLHAAMREEMVREYDIDQYVRSILETFVRGEQFSFQLSLGAIAAACVGINKAFARDFVAYLAKMRSAEMYLSTQIAGIALQSIPTTIRETITENATESEVQYLDSVPRSDAGQTTIVIEEELINA